MSIKSHYKIIISVIIAIILISSSVIYFYPHKNNTMNLIKKVSNTTIKSYGESYEYRISEDQL